MADSSLKLSLLELRLDNNNNNCRNGLLHRVDREFDSHGDPCLIQAVNCCEGEPSCRSSCSATQSALTIDHITGFNNSFQDYHYIQQQPELHLPPEIPPSTIPQPTLGMYPSFSSLVSTAQQRQSMISNNITGVNQPSRIPGVERASHSEPNLSSASFASIVAWRQDSNVLEGDCHHEGESCTPFHTLVQGASSYTPHQPVPDTLDNSFVSENIMSRTRIMSSVSDSGRSSPSEHMLSATTSLGYSLTSRGNVCPDNITRNSISRSSGHRLNASTIRVLRSQSPRGSTSIRSRRISSSTRSLSPLNIGLALYHSTNDGDNLPVLLSPSDRSERDRPPTPVAISETGSQTLSEDSRSRFIHPGTPIQMHLPELPSLLDADSTPSERSDGSSEIWLITNDGPSGGALSLENSFLNGGDDEDVFGCDKERAKELLDGLEVVEPHLVRRYKKVRGEDICIICRDTFLRQDNNNHNHNHVAEAKESPQQDNGDPSSNLHALSPLPLSSSVSDSSIHAFPCAHLFHSTCLFPWLSIKTTCPTCRLDIDPHSLTLRIRQWFGTSDNQEPSYVNVDILGRRIPWHKPQAPNIEEWIQARETEMMLQQ